MLWKKIGKLFSIGGKLRWLLLALIREKPLPMKLVERPQDLTNLQRMALEKADVLYGIMLEENKK